MMLTILFFLLNHCSPELHDFHLSKALVKYVEEEKSLQISLHVFQDDFEIALSDFAGRAVKLVENDTLNNDVLTSYLEETLSFKSNDSTISYSLIGFEPSEDELGMWIYLEAMPVQLVGQLDVTNVIMQELFTDQKNILQIQALGRVKYFIADSDNFTFNIKQR